MNQQKTKNIPGSALLEVFDLSGQSGRQNSMRSGIGRLIELVGTSRFEEEVFHIARMATRCAHLTAFAVHQDSSPRVLYAANTGPAQVAKQVARRYLANYWTLDPARRFESLARGNDDKVAIRITSYDIDDDAYRHECYAAVRVHDRFTVMQQRFRETVCLNFYRGVGIGPFGRSDIDRIVNTADLLIALIMKHEVSAPRSDPRLTDTFVDRLRLIDPTLPPREAEICGAIAIGMTSEAIALTLGISINTVLTYRKRAYTRLGVSSQNELLRLVLQ